MSCSTLLPCIGKTVGGQIKELYVTVDAGESLSGYWISRRLRLSSFVRSTSTVVDGQVVEVNLGIRDWLQLLDEKLRSGYVITVDYGAEAEDLYGRIDAHQGTLRAFRRHEFVDDVLQEPGAYDITSTIDWTCVKAEGKRLGFYVEEFEPLDRFLMKEGILDELEKRLASAKSDAHRTQLTTAAREMILPGGMASSFQVLVQRKISV